jgi:hypothetical protein
MAEMKREPERDFQTIEQARNAAISWMESRGVRFGPHRRIEIGRLGVMTGKEVGVRSEQGPFWRLRLDYDPIKGPHFNAEFGSGATRQKMAFKFVGTETLIRTLAKARAPR